MGKIEELLRDVPLPRMVRVRQTFDDTRIENVQAEVLTQLSRPAIVETIHPGMRICLTCSSRGIDNLALILRTVAGFCRGRGAVPFIVPAMGSHGGATAEGQMRIANGYGVTEEYCGCPVISCMDTVKIGTAENGIDVFIDRHAAEADGIIVVGRIKPHTAFEGPYESGLMKMMAIGLGKQYGASVCHSRGFAHMAEMVPAFGRTILAHAGVLFGLAILENAYDKTCKLRALTREEIPAEEPGLLKEAKSLMPRILFDPVDVLVIDRIGKNISGDGMDPNITGRFGTPYKKGGIRTQRLVVLDLTDESHGNGMGLGQADITTKRVYDKFDFEETYPNALTCRVFCGTFLPTVMPNDRLALQAAVSTCVDANISRIRLVRLRDTLHLDEILVSEALAEGASGIPGVETLDGPEEMHFGGTGNLF